MINDMEAVYADRSDDVKEPGQKLLSITNHIDLVAKFVGVFGNHSVVKQKDTNRNVG